MPRELTELPALMRVSLQFVHFVGWSLIPQHRYVRTRTREEGE